ncbi:MAG: hypothetical protein IPP74_14525 [Alphaproteobacteria bacterium]|nr:hypothetical protein [Alphaproteobacteria bacterium]
MSEEDIKKLATALKGGDRDSFASFTSGLRTNWVFIIAVAGVAMWVFNSFSAVDAVNVQQDAQIQAITVSITQLTANVVALTAKSEADNQNQNLIQQDIALIKADIGAIKEDLKK